MDPTLTLMTLALLGLLLAVIALVQVIAYRLSLPESILLVLVGIGLGGLHVLARSQAHGVPLEFLRLLVNPPIPAESYLWLFLPPLLFQAALTIDVRHLITDAAPILLLAVVAVFVATVVVGLGLMPFAKITPAACLLLGSVIATTDPSAVLAVFQTVGAPSRLIRLVEGESLLNDAAAIAIAGVLVATLTGDAAHASLGAGLRSLCLSFGGGVLFGALLGRLACFLLPRMADLAAAEAALTLALPYPLYLLADQWLGVSGVVTVVSAGLVINGLGRTRMTPGNWAHMQMIWEQVARIVGAVAILLAAIRVPDLLHGATLRDGLLLIVVIVGATVARLLVLFGLLPVLSLLRLSEPVSAAYKLAITWGGLRGAVTLVLALGIAQNQQLPLQLRHTVAILATGFVLYSLLINGTTLRKVIHRLGLDQLSPSERALQQQSIQLSTVAVEKTLAQTALAFGISQQASAEVAAEYRRDMALGAAAFDLDTALRERERFAIGLVTLATRERDLIPEYGSGIITVSNLDAMMRNTGLMIDAARKEGRLGYNRVARAILHNGWNYRLALFLHRYLRLHAPLAKVLADRFELLVCRRAVLERLLGYNQSYLATLLGRPVAELLQTVLRTRAKSVDDSIAQMRRDFGQFTAALERRLLLLFALRQGRNAIEQMVNERIITMEVYNGIRNGLKTAWQRNLPRPRLDHPDLRHSLAAQHLKPVPPTVAIEPTVPLPRTPSVDDPSPAMPAHGTASGHSPAEHAAGAAAALDPPPPTEPARDKDEPPSS